MGAGDYYTLPELAFKLNVYKRDIYSLSALGPGFEIMRIYVKPAYRYVVPRNQVYEWARIVFADKNLKRAAKRISPHILSGFVDYERRRDQRRINGKGVKN